MREKQRQKQEQKPAQFKRKQQVGVSHWKRLRPDKDGCPLGFGALPTIPAGHTIERSGRIRLDCVRVDHYYGGRKRGQMIASYGGAQSKGRQWLPIILIKLLILFTAQTPIIPSNCDEGTSAAPLQMHPFDITQELDDQLSGQLNQHKGIDYLIHQHHQHQNLAPTSGELAIEAGSEDLSQASMEFGGEFSSDHSDESSLISEQFARDSQAQQQQQFIEDLLEAQSSASNPTASAPNSTEATTAAAAAVAAALATSNTIRGEQTLQQETQTTNSSTIPSLMSPPAAMLAPASPQQVGETSSRRPTKAPAMGSLLSQLTGQSSQSTNYETLISGMSNSILGPIRSQTAAMGQKVRKTILAASNQQQQASDQVASSSSRPQIVGQSIDGNIEYDSNQNAINGFIEFPSGFGLGNNSQKLTMAALKPLAFAALKTVPIKLGSIGWKLLQLIALKKIYKTHHPNSGEFEVEQEIRHRDPVQASSQQYQQQQQQQPFATYGGRMVDSESIARPHKSSKMGRSYSAMRDPNHAAASQIMMSANYASGPGGWPFAASSPMETAPSLYRGSMGHQQHAYSRPLASGVHMGSGSSASSSHPAMAAAAAAATAAALQAQWAQQQQQQQQQSAAGDPEGQQQQQQQKQQLAGEPNDSSMRGYLVHQKRGSSIGANWFVGQAQAYANALQSLSQQQRQQLQQQLLATDQQQNQNAGQGLLTRLGRRGSSRSRAQQLEQVGLQPISGAQYQSLFDNAAALAVQNAVKLPQVSSGQSAGDLLEQTDSLSGGSLSSLAASSIGASSSEGWPEDNGLHRASLQPGPSGRLSDSLLGLNGADGADTRDAAPDFDDSPLDSALSPDYSSSNFGRRRGLFMVGQN